MKKILLILLMSVFGISAFSQTNSSLQHSKELLESMGTAKVSMQVVSTMFASFKKQLPNVPSEFWDECIKEFSPQEMIDLVAPIYAKYYTDDELVQLIQFYKTPLGKKVTETLPMITQDSYSAGEEWGRKIAEKVQKRLKEKGYLKNV